MVESLEIRAKLYDEEDEKIDGFNSLLEVNGIYYQLSLPKEVQEDGVKKIHVQH